MQLTRVLFESATPAALAMGLHSGQERCQSIVNRTGWYNLAGEMLGWGDLNEEDVIRIMCQSVDDDVFLVLRSTESFWRFDDHRFTDATQADIAKPGTDYVVNNAWLAITSEGLFFVDSIDDPAWASMGNFGPLPSMHKETLFEIAATQMVPVSSS